MPITARWGTNPRSASGSCSTSICRSTSRTRRAPTSSSTRCPTRPSWRPRAAPSRRRATGWSRRQPARWRTPCWRAFGAEPRGAGRGASRLRRSRRSLPMSGGRLVAAGPASSGMSADLAEALLALGGNLGPVRETFDRALAMLCDGGEVRLKARSSDYATPPWGVEDQPPFVNLCVAVETALTPRALLGRVQAVEHALGRARADARRWGPRPIDIGILAYAHVTLDDAHLTLPHPRLLE